MGGEVDNDGGEVDNDGGEDSDILDVGNLSLGEDSGEEAK